MATDFDNITGSHATASGTSPLTVGAALKYNRGIDAVLSDADVRTFFAVDATGTDYQLFIGQYTASGTTISVDSVIHSSASDNPVDWTGAAIEVLVVASKDEIVGDETEVGDLQAASTLQGDEILPGLQGGLARKFTTQQLAPDAIVQAQRYDRRTLQRFTDFLDVADGESVTTDGALFGLCPVRTTIAFSGSVESNPASFPIHLGVAHCKTGTNIFGRAGVLSTITPLLPNNTQNIVYFGMYAGVNAVPTTTSNEFSITVGWFSDPSATITDGLFFFADHNNANWQVVSRSGGTSTTTDSLVPVVAATVLSQLTTFEVVYNHNDDETKFYIDGVEVHAQADTTNFPAVACKFVGGYVQNLGSSTSNELWADAMNVRTTLDGTGAGYSTGDL